MAIISRTGTFVLSVVLAMMLTGSSASAEDPSASNFPFGKASGSIYLGGTAGLTGADSLRGYFDSLFYAKWAAGYEPALNLAVVSPTVIYGDDDRVDIYTVTDPNLLKLSQATCTFVSLTEISDNGDGTYTVLPTAWISQGGLPLCEGERFAGQMLLGHCSAFLVAEDLIVTAGHCLSAATCGSWAILFGYQQTDSLTPPPTIVSANDVYFCIEVLDRVFSGDLDHCVARLDRPVVGRSPIPIRRSGLVDNATPLVVVGHPTNLPMKVAGGAEVQDNQGAGVPWFQANTDTYGGNSGSMIVNTDTWFIEGILVRGAPDFVFNGGCTASNEVPNTGNTGGGLTFEEISKITTIAYLIPELVTSTGALALDASDYSCDQQIGIELIDLDLTPFATYDILLISSAADSELVILNESSIGSGIYDGFISTASGSVVVYDGQLQVSDGDIITAIYEDADDGSGSPATAVATAGTDCVIPVISNLTVTAVGATTVELSFNTDEPALGHASVGTICGNYDYSGPGSLGTLHELTISGLEPGTDYYLSADATDLTGNTGVDDNGGLCYAFSTSAPAEYFTEQFIYGSDMEGKTILFVPDGSEAYYHACLFDAVEYPHSPGGTELTLGNDDFGLAEVGGGNQVSLYGQAYASIYVGSNGYVTFGDGDTDWSESIEEHLGGLPRIAVFWDDLDPTSGGSITYRSLEDRMIVTWEDIEENASSNILGAQLLLYYDGTISMTYLTIEPNDGLIGLSAGSGSPDFVPSDLSAYSACNLITCYYDEDGDSYGAEDDPGHFQADPFCGAGFSDNTLDCDDDDDAISPDGVEILDDGIDQDCDGDDASCCAGKVGDVNGLGGDEPTIGDVSRLVDHLFITQAPLDCYQEADINQSGGRYPTADDITIGDISMLIDHLFISQILLNDCL